MMVITIICAICIIIIVILAAILDMNKGGSTIIGILLGVIISILAMTIIEEISQSIKPIDVYRGKTTLEITYRDSIAIDSVVIWKEE